MGDKMELIELKKPHSGFTTPTVFNIGSLYIGSRHFSVEEEI